MNIEDRLLIGELYEVKSLLYIVSSDQFGNYDKNKTDAIFYLPGEKFVVTRKVIGKSDEDSFFVCYSLGMNIFFPFYVARMKTNDNFDKFLKHLKVQV